MPLPRATLLALALAACPSADVADTDTPDATDSPVVDTGEPVPPPPLVAGAPLAGAAEGTLKLPVGTPLAGFTARCGCLGGGIFEVDDRDSHYSDAFIESAGVHLRPTIKVIWVENGDDHLVITKTDTIYSFDGLVQEVTNRLEALTGEDLRGKVTHTTNHNHSSYGTFSKHTGFFLGHDKFNRENFERMADQITQVAYQAYQNRKPAKLGFGNTWGESPAKSWDPDNKVYSDRRGENNDLVVFDDLGPEQGGKDPNLHLLRVDDAVTDTPIAVLFSFGMHPYVFGEDNALVTGDATATIEEEVSESFDTPVVSMFVQGSGGDASVRGSDDGWARMETVGAYARDAILALREQTPTSANPIKLETSSKSLGLAHDEIRVTRNGTVDWYFPPGVTSEDYEPDGLVFDPSGNLISPLDEFHTELGGVFCGSGSFDLPVGGFNTEVDPYGYCMRVELMLDLLKVFFDLDPSQVTPPIDGMSQTYLAASMIDGIPVRRADGTTADAAKVLFGFAPGETLHLYSEMWRHRVRDEFGIVDTMLAGYSMDHNGYLMIMEDWVLGGYEPDITFWGPIGGEHILEGLLYDIVADELTTDVNEFYDLERDVELYRDWPFENRQPDVTDAAAIKLLTQPEIETCDPKDGTTPNRACYASGLRFYLPAGFSLDLTIPDELERLQPIQVAWIGGDPGVDDPRLTIERQEQDGTWQPIRTHSGKLVTDDFHDFGIAYTPDPLYPAEAQQTHFWWATWQAVQHVRDRAGLPEGTYRMKIQGNRFVGGDTDFPWAAEPYELTTKTFTVVPAPLTISKDGDALLVSLQGPSKNGFRMIDVRGRSTGANPLTGDVAVTWYVSEGDPVEATVPAGEPVNGRTSIPFPTVKGSVIGAYVVDAYGNDGSWGTVPDL